MLLVRLSARASVRGWKWLSAFLLDLDLALSGLSGASRRIRREASSLGGTGGGPAPPPRPPVPRHRSRPRRFAGGGAMIPGLARYLDHPVRFAPVVRAIRATRLRRWLCTGVSIPALAAGWRPDPRRGWRTSAKARLSE